jgi:hypothetical protein
LLRAILLLPAAAAAQTDGLYRNDVAISFRQSSAVIDEHFDNNGARLGDLIARLHRIAADTTLSILSIEISGMASPEGRSDFNAWLSNARLTALERYIRERIDLPDSIIVHDDRKVGWSQLDTLVAASDMPYRNEVLYILRHTPQYIFAQGRIVDGKKKQLMELNYGRTWREMYRRFFPALRNTCAVWITYGRRRPAKPARLPAGDAVPALQAAWPPVIPPVATLAGIAPRGTEPVERDTLCYVALNTNTLYLLGAVPNAGLEIALRGGWSFALSWHHAWWSKDARHRYWRTYGGEVALRRWLAADPDFRSPLQGHHVGVYVQALTWDFEWGGRGYLAARPVYAAGAEWGYARRLARRLQLQFVLGFGYLSGEYKEYLPESGLYMWQVTKRLRWVGPTKAEVALVWIPGPLVYKKRGGHK